VPSFAGGLGNVFSFQPWIPGGSLAVERGSKGGGASVAMVGGRRRLDGARIRLIMWSKLTNIIVAKEGIYFNFLTPSRFLEKKCYTFHTYISNFF
jgi:hypothetical protein